MGRRLRGIVGALKDKASLSRATLLCSSTATATSAATTTTSSPHMAVLRATTHHPSASPPHPRHIQALLAFGHGSRLAAAACVAALTARLRSTRDASVALKSLLAVHYVVAHGAFILKDQLSAAFLPASGQNPLNLSAFRDDSSHDSWALSAWVRWYARVLELLLAASRDLGNFPNHNASFKGEGDEDHVSSLLNEDLLSELESLVGFVEETRRTPEEPGDEGNGLVREAVRLMKEDRITAEREIRVRVREMGERLGSIGFATSVELVCLLRRLEDCRDRPLDGKWTDMDDGRFWDDVRDVMKRAGEVVLRKEEEERERGRRVSRDRVSESARYMDRGHPEPTAPIRFGSSRWSDR